MAEAVEYTVELDFFLFTTRLNELIGRCVSRNPPKYELKFEKMLIFDASMIE